MADYSKIKYNPFDVPTGTMIWERYPALTRRAHLSSVPVKLFEKFREESIPKPKTLSLLVSFVILLCDPASPFYDERDYNERQVACLESLRIHPEVVAYSMIVENHWWFRLILTTYFQMVNVTLFESWLSMKIDAHQQKAKLRRAADLDDEKLYDLRVKVSGSFRKNDADMLAIEKLLFPDEMTKEAVNDIVASDRIGGYAEEFALDEFP